MLTRKSLRRFSTANAIAWTALYGVGLARLDLIVPRSVWEATAWRVLRPTDGPFPGCGTKIAKDVSSGNGNESMWYISLEGSEASINCANQILDSAPR